MKSAQIAFIDGKSILTFNGVFSVKLGLTRVINRLLHCYCSPLH